MMGLTPRQADCLAVIRAAIAERGVPPSYDGMAAALGIRSKSGVHRLVEALVVRGYVRRLPHLARSLSLVEPHMRGGAESILAFLADKTGKSRDQLVTQAIEEFALRQVQS